MKEIRTILIFIALTITFFSCSTKSKNDLIIGKWTFDKIEKVGKTSMENADEMKKNSEGLIATFNDNGTFISIKTQGEYKDTLGNGSYEITKDGKFIVTHDTGTRNTDTVEIIELNAKILKVQTSNKDVLVLKKIQ
jgi:hypothetical protein